MGNESASWTVSSLVSGVGDVVNGAVDLAASNPLIAVFLGMSLVAAGYGLFTSFRRKSKH